MLNEFEDSGSCTSFGLVGGKKFWQFYANPNAVPNVKPNESCKLSLETFNMVHKSLFFIIKVSVIYSQRGSFISVKICKDQVHCMP